MEKFDRVFTEAELRALFGKVHPGLSYEEIRACLAGGVLTLWEIPARDILGHLFNEQGPAWREESEAAEYMEGYASLWNSLVDIVQGHEPFSFSEWKPVSGLSPEEISRRAEGRERELEQILWGLRTGGTPFAEDFEDAPPEFLEAWMPEYFEKSLREMRAAREAFARGEAGAAERLNELHERLNSEVAERHPRFAAMMHDMQEELDQATDQGAD